MSTGGSRTTSVGGIITLLGALLTTSLVAGILGAGLLMPVVGAAGAVAQGGVHAFDSLPAELKQSPLAQQSKILAADGSTIATFYDENRIVVPLSKVAPIMQTAIVAIEDSRFYKHGGVDPHGIARAFISNAQGDEVQGASTLTQQYVKLTLVENALADGDTQAAKEATDRSGTSGYARKLQELKYAVTLEKTMNKQQILQGYLNIAYFGGGAYGVESAALHYFDVHASKLTLPQAALLAGLVQAPTAYDPQRSLSAATSRRNVVLARMLQLKDVTQTQYNTAVKSKITLHVHQGGNDCSSSKYPYFCNYVRQILSSTNGIGAAALQRGGLTVKTTLDPKVENAAQKAINKIIPAGNSARVGSAASTVQPGTGKILAMVQSSRFLKTGKKKKWDTTQVNWNTDQSNGGSAGFQTGSSFKAYTLAAALKSGMKLNDTVNAPKDGTNFPPGSFRDCQGGGFGSYAPHNSEGDEAGTMTLVKATQNSVNTAFVKLEEEVGLCKVATLAGDLGVHRADKLNGTTALYQSPSMTLGANEIAPLTMAAGYATFAAQGEYCSPIAITSITSASGKKYDAPKANCHQAIGSDVANGVTYALERVITSGTAAGMELNGRIAAGKTGTTNNEAQAWFVGYTPQLATAVYTGHPLKSNKSLNFMDVGGRRYGTVFGATVSAPIWRLIMNSADSILNLPAKSFTSPPSSMIGSPPAPPKPTNTPTQGPTGSPTGPGGGGTGGGGGGNGGGGGGGPTGKPTKGPGH